MKYQAEVKNTQKYEDSQGSHIVTTGKLILIERDIESDSLLTESSIGIISKREGDIIYDRKGLDPIIISETEEIEEGDKVYNDAKPQNQRDIIFEIEKKFVESANYHSDLFHKILALPEHFSDKHLQAIVDGKMREGEVLLKCTHESNDYYNQKEFAHSYKVYLNLQNHITLFPVKQSLEEAAFEYANSDEAVNEISHLPQSDQHEYAFKAGAEWAKKNNY